MNLDATWLFLSLIPSGAGLVLFIYGKKQQRMPQLVSGLALMIYAYFTQSVTSLVGVGVAIAGALYWSLWYGW